MLRKVVVSDYLTHTTSALQRKLIVGESREPYGTIEWMDGEMVEMCKAFKAYGLELALNT